MLQSLHETIFAFYQSSVVVYFYQWLSLSKWNGSFKMVL